MIKTGLNFHTIERGQETIPKKFRALRSYIIEFKKITVDRISVRDQDGLFVEASKQSRIQKIKKEIRKKFERKNSTQIDYELYVYYHDTLFVEHRSTFGSKKKEVKMHYFKL